MVVRFRMSKRSRICQARCFDIPVWTAKASRTQELRGASADNGGENARTQITAAHIYTAIVWPSPVNYDRTGYESNILIITIHIQASWEKSFLRPRGNSCTELLEICQSTHYYHVFRVILAISDLWLKPELLGGWSWGAKIVKTFFDFFFQ